LPANILHIDEKMILKEDFILMKRNSKSQNPKSKFQRRAWDLKFGIWFFEFAIWDLNLIPPASQ
jgi:hypothetical protein